MLECLDGSRADRARESSKGKGIDERLLRPLDRIVLNGGV